MSSRPGIRSASSARIRLTAVIASATLCLATAGCGTGPLAVSSAEPTQFTISGSVYGGQQPVNLAQIFLYQVGNTGNGSVAMNLLTTAVYTNARGYFSTTGKYSCTDTQRPIYIVSSGGDPGTGTANSVISLVATLGPCGYVMANAANIFININEMTTVGAAYGLGGFATAPDHIGSSATNLAGMLNAFNNVSVLVNNSRGLANTSSSTVRIESAKLSSLANTVAACVNGTASSYPCTALFAAAPNQAGTPAPDTFTALLNIVHNPGNNVQTIYDLAPPTAVFGGGLTSQPNDWTVSATLLPPTNSCYSNLAIDSQSTVWAADSCGSQLFAFTPAGAAVSGSPFGAGVLNNPYATMVDPTGDVWVGNFESGASPLPSPNSGKGYLTRFQGSTGSTPGASIGNTTNSTNYYFDSSTNQPFYLYARANGNFLISNIGATKAVTEYTSSGTTVSSVGGINGLLRGVPDTTGGFFALYPTSGGATHYPAGNYANPVVETCCNGLKTGATDASGNFWGTYQNEFSVVTNADATLIGNHTYSGVDQATDMSIDAGGVVWVVSGANNSGSGPLGFAAISTGTGTTGYGSKAQSTVLSPTTGLGLDANLMNPGAIVPDSAGDLWVTDIQTGIVEFFGLATPTATPLLPTPTAP